MSCIHLNGTNESNEEISRDVLGWGGDGDRGCDVW